MTKRQAVLLERLVTFCGRCGSPDLPMKVDCVIGYGSFFRGKPNPDDVDLIAMVSRRHPGFERFCDLVDKDLRTRRGEATPRDRMRRLARAHPDPEVQRLADVYAAWLGDVSDHWLYEQTTILGGAALMMGLAVWVRRRRGPRHP